MTPPGIFAQPDFVRLWSVGLIVFVVRWLETLAIGVFVYRDTGSAFAVAMMTMLRMLPMGLFGALLGTIAERVDRRRALIFVVAQMMATSATLAVLAISGRLAIWHLAVACFLNGLNWATDNPIRRAMMGDIVGGERMGRAMSADVASNNSSRMLGPTVGGVLLASVGIEGAFALCALLYVYALWSAIRVTPAGPQASAGTGSILARMRDGLAAVRRDRRLIGTLLVTIIYNMFGWPFSAMVVVIGKDSLGLGPVGIGMLSSTEGIGAFLGAMAVAFWVKPRHYCLAYVGGVALYLCMLIVVAQVPNAVVAATALLFCGVGGAGFAIMQNTIVYLAAPADMRGRVLGILSVCIGTAAIGFFFLGTTAQYFGVVPACTANGVIGLFLVAATWKYWRMI